MDLAEDIAQHIERDARNNRSLAMRLHGVPRAVFIDAIRMALDDIEERCTAGQTVESLFADTADSCENCDAFLRRDDPAVAFDPDGGVALCASCIATFPPSGCVDAAEVP